MNPKTGIILKLVATLAFTAMQACVKGLEGSFPIGAVIFYRALFALFPLVIWLQISGQRIAIPNARNAARILPGAFAGLGGMYFGFTALIYLPLVQVIVLSYTTPLFIIILAAVLLKEVVRIYRWTAVAVGFTGVFVTLVPELISGGASFSADKMMILGTALALVSALCAALSSIAIRGLTTTQPPLTIVLVYTLASLAIGTALVGTSWTMPDLKQILLLAGCGFAGGIGQITMTLSLRHAQASLLAPFDYATLIWAAMFGYLFLAELPTIATLLGGLLVVAAGLFSGWRESRLSKR